MYSYEVHEMQSYFDFLVKGKYKVRKKKNVIFHVEVPSVSISDIPIGWYSCVLSDIYLILT